MLLYFCPYHANAALSLNGCQMCDFAYKYVLFVSQDYTCSVNRKCRSKHPKAGHHWPTVSLSGVILSNVDTRPSCISNIIHSHKYT